MPGHNRDDEASFKDFPPLLDRMEQSTSLWGREGKLSLEVTAFGEIMAAFISGGFRADDIVDPREIGRADADLTLADGHAVAFKRCVAPQRHGLPLGPQPWQLHAEQVTVRTPWLRPRWLEFGLVNLWLHLDWPPILFDGLQVGLSADLPGHNGYRNLKKGDSAPVMYWARIDIPPENDIERSWDVVQCMADTFSMLLHQRVLMPCYRIVDAEGEVAEFHCRLQAGWPTVGERLRYTVNERAALEAVGRSHVRRRFAELDLRRYVSYLMEARREDMPVEQNLMCALIALESISARWKGGHRRNRRGRVPYDLTEKLNNMNESLLFMDSKYLGSRLQNLRNSIMHSGNAEGKSVAQILDATDELVLLATDIFFRIFGFARETVARTG